MAWPVSQDYNEAIQDPQSSFHDPELRAGEATTNVLGMPMPRSGNFADVYEFLCPDTKSKWAIKCFTRHVTGLRKRYLEIGKALADAKLPFTVDFQYLVQGMRVRGEWFPILKMRWVEGLLLNEFVRDNLDKPAHLNQLGLIWGRMAKRLRDAEIAHADLQHGNVLLVAGSKSSSLAVKLIDYDGMFVPALAKTKSGEVGHPNYQHPQRLREGIYNGEVDRFPLLVVATALRALSVGGRELWERHDNGDNLLFRETDLQAPEKSALLKELKEITEPQTRALVTELEKAIGRKLEEIPAIDELIPEAKPTSVRVGSDTHVTAKAPEPMVAPVVSTAPVNDARETKRKPKEQGGGVPIKLLIGVGAAAAVLLVSVLAAGVGWMMLKKNDPIVQVKPPEDADRDRKKKVVPDPVKDKDGKDKNKDKDKGEGKPPVVGPPIDNGNSGPSEVIAPKSKGPPDLIAELPIRSPFCLSCDGSLLAYSIGRPGVVGYRKTPDWESEQTVNLPGATNLVVDPLTSYPDGKKMIFGAGRPDAGMLIVWNWATNQVNFSVPTPGKPQIAYLSPDLKYLAAEVVQFGKGTPPEHWVFLFNVQTGKEIKSWQGKSPTGNFGFTPDSSKLFFALLSDPVNRVFSTKDGAPGAPEMFPFALSKYRQFFSRDFTQVVNMPGTTLLQVAAAGVKEPITTMRSPDPKVYFRLPVFSPDGRHLLVGMDDVSKEAPERGRVMFVEAKTGTPLSTTDPFMNPPLRLQLAAGGIGAFQNGMWVRIYRFPTTPGEVVAKVTPPVTPSADGFVPLFNGKDLTGWVPTGKTQFFSSSVVNGVLETTNTNGFFGTPVDSEQIELIHKRVDFTDFHLRIEGQYTGRYSSWITIRSASPAKNYRFLLPGTNDAAIENRNFGGLLIPGMQPVDAKPPTLKPGEWFACEIIAKGNQLTVLEKGVSVLSHVDMANRSDKGGLAFTVTPGSTFRIRKVEIKELKTEPSPPVLVKEGFVPLFNGKDLTGWQPGRQQPKGIWRVEGGAIIGPPRFAMLRTVRDDYQDCHVRVEARFRAVDAKGGHAGVWCRSHPDKGYGYRALVSSDGIRFGQVQSINKSRNRQDGGVNVAIAPGEWFKLEVIVLGKRVRVLVNGATTGEYLDEQSDAGSGCIALHQDAEGTFETRKIEVMELNPDGTLLVRKDPPKSKNDPPKTKDLPIKFVRVPPPDADKVTEATKAIRNEFPKEYAKKAPADVFALAEKLLQLAKETNDDPVSRYALLREAISLATKAGRIELTMKATAELTSRYEIDEMTAKVDAFLGLSKAALTADTSKQFVEAALSFAGGAIMDDHFDESSKVLGAADSVARKFKNTVLLTQIQKQEAQVKEIAKENAEMKKAQEQLSEDANDAAANLTAGSYLAFRKGDWERGLPLLALSNQADLQDLAKKDAAATDDDKARVEIGDAWWNAGEKKPAHQKVAMQARAAHWYRLALPTLTGLTQTRIAARVKQLDEQPAPFRLAGSVAEVDRLKGHVGSVNWLSLSGDGRRVFSCGNDGTVREWNYSTGKSRVMVGPQFTKSQLSCFALSPDERYLAFLNAFGKMSTLDLGTLSPLKFGKGEREAVPGFFWSGDTKVTYVTKKEWHTWDPAKGSGSTGALVIAGPDVEYGNARLLVLSPDQDVGAAICQDGTVGICRIVNGGGRNASGVIKYVANMGAFSKDGRFIVLAAKTGDLSVFKTQGGNLSKEVVSLTGQKSTVRCLAYSPNGEKIVSGGDNRMLHVWDAGTGKEIQRFQHPGAVMSVIVTPDNRYAITACTDSFIRIWSLSAPAKSK